MYHLLRTRGWVAVIRYAIVVLTAVGPGFRALGNLEPIPLAEALDTSALVWETGGDFPWMGFPGAGKDGDDGALAGLLSAGATAWLKTNVSGPAKVSFWTLAGGNTTLFQVDGSRRLSNGSGWVEETVWLAGGSHELKWEASGGAMSLDRVAVAAGNFVSLAEGADVPGRTVEASASDQAIGVADASVAGAAGGDWVAVQGASGGTGHPVPEISTQIAGPMRVSFQWQLKGAGSGSGVEVFDGTGWLRCTPLLQAGGWQTASFSVGAGPQTVRWRSFGPPSESGAPEWWFDALSFESTPLLGEAVGQPALAFTLPDSAWSTVTDIAAEGGSAAMSPKVGPGGQSRLAMAVTGPAQISCVTVRLAASPGWSWEPDGPVPVALDGVTGGGSERLGNGWYRTSVFVPEGAHEVSWVVKSEGPAAGSSDPAPFKMGLVDSVTVTPTPGVDLGTGSDSPVGWDLQTDPAAGSGRWRGYRSLASPIEGDAVVAGPIISGHPTTLQGTVTGPARVTFYGRMERGTAADAPELEVRIDSSAVASLRPTVAAVTATEAPLGEEWNLYSVDVPAGPHVLAFRFNAGGSSTDPLPALVFLDGVSVWPADPGDAVLPSAAGLAGSTWARTMAGGGGGWRQFSPPGFTPDRNAVACLDVEPGESATVETNVTGPGRLAFEWSRAGGGFGVRIDGVLHDLSAESPDRTAKTYSTFVGAGNHAVQWVMEPVPGGGGRLMPVQGWIDSVTFTANPTGSLPDALDTMLTTVSSGGAWPWGKAPIPYSPAGNGDADAAFTEIAAGAESWMEMAVTGPVRCAFWGRAEDGYGTVLLDGTYVGQIERQGSWRRQEVVIGPGAHVLRWQLQATSGKSARAWVTGFEPLPIVPVGEALEAPGLSWSSGAATSEFDPWGWVGLSGAALTGDPASLVDDAATSQGTGPLTTTVTGPAVLEFEWQGVMVPVPPPSPDPAFFPIWKRLPHEGTAAASLPQVKEGTADVSPAAVGGPVFPDRSSSDSYTAVCSVDGVARAWLSVVELPTVRQKVAVPIPAGAHAVTWAGPYPSPDRRLIVDKVAVQPVPTAALAAEFGVSEGTVGVSGAMGWEVDSAVVHDGPSSVASPAVSTPEWTQLELAVDGPARISFWWKGDLGEGPGAEASFRSIDPGSRDSVAVNDSSTVSFDWRQLAFTVGSGKIRLVWSLRATVGIGRRIWIDGMAVTPLNAADFNETLAEAFDTPGAVWQTGGKWLPSSRNGQGWNDNDAALGPLVAGTQKSWIETSVTGPAWVSVHSKMDLTGDPTPHGVTPQMVIDGGRPTATVDGSGVAVASRFHWSGVRVPAGSHTVRLNWPAATQLIFDPRALVDEVRLPMSFAEAIDAPALTWTALPAGGTAVWPAWRTQGDPAHPTVVGTPVHAATGNTTLQMQVSVAGPALVSFDGRRAPRDAVEIGGDSPVIPSRLSLSFGGVVRWTSDWLGDAWSTFTMPIPAGAQTLTWTVPTLNGVPKPVSDFWLDRFTVTNLQNTETLGDALEMPGQSWTGVHSSFLPWIGAPGTDHEDYAGFVLSTYTPAGVDLMTTSVTGPAWLSFDHRESFGAARVSVDGATVWRVGTTAGDSGWNRCEPLFLPPGVHSVSLGLDSNSSTSPARVAFDRVTVETATQVTMAEAVDLSGVSITEFPSPGTWKPVIGPGAVGGDAIVAQTPTGSGSTPFLSIGVTGPSIFSWVEKWTVENPAPTANTNPFWVTLDSQAVFPLVGEVPSVRSLSIPQGDHVVALYPHEIPAQSTLWLDNFSVGPVPTVADEISIPGATVTSSGKISILPVGPGESRISLGGADFGTVPRGQITIQLTGPGELAFDFTNTQASGSLEIDHRAVPVPSSGGARLALGPGPHVLRFAQSENVSWKSFVLGNVGWSPSIPHWAEVAGGFSNGAVLAWAAFSSSEPVVEVLAGIGPQGCDAIRQGALFAVPAGPGSYSSWVGVVAPGTGRSADLIQRPVSNGVVVALPSSPWLAGAVFTLASTVPLGEALDRPAWPWETSADAPWLGLPTSTAAVGDSAVQASFPLSTPTWVGTTIEGPGLLSFKYLGGRDVVASVSVGSVVKSLKAPVVKWQDAQEWLPQGQHVVRWTVTTGDVGNPFWLDAVDFNASLAVSLSDALGWAGAPLVRGGTRTWEAFTLIPGAEGGSAAVLGPLGVGEDGWIETTVPEGGQLRFRWGFNAPPPPPYSAVPDAAGALEFSIDGQRLGLLNQLIDWQEQIWNLPPGAHTLRWRHVGPSASAPGATPEIARLDGLTFTPGSQASAYSAALGQPELPMIVGGSAAWTAVPPVGTTPGSAVATFNGIQNEAGWSTEVVGPAVARLSVPGGDGSVALAWTLDGQSHMPGYDNGARVFSLFVPSGVHRLALRARPYALSGSFEIRDFAVRPFESATFAEALEVGGSTISNDPAIPWQAFRDPSVASGDGDFALVPLRPNETSSFQLTVAGPGTLEVRLGSAPFSWGAAQLVLSENGTSLLQLSHAVETQSLPLPPGNHVLTLTATNGQTNPVLAVVHSLGFTPISAVPIDVAFDAPGRSFAQPADLAPGFWTGVVDPAAQQGTSLVKAFVRPGQSALLETTVSGPADLSFWWKMTGPARQSLNVAIDGIPVRTDTLGSQQPDKSGTASIHVFPGSHKVQWLSRNQSSENDSSAYLDHLVITPVESISLAEAVDVPGWPLPIDGVNGWWEGVAVSDAVGGDALRVTTKPTDGLGVPPRLFIAASGPGILRWSWKLAPPTSTVPGYWSVTQSGLGELLRFTQTGVWSASAMLVPAGTATVMFEVGNNLTGLASVAGWLDGLTWEPFAAGKTLADAVDATGITGWTAGSENVFPVTGALLSGDGIDSAALRWTPGGTQTLSAAVTGAGTLRFRTRVIGSSSDRLDLLVDGTAVAQMAAIATPPNNPGTPWIEKSIFIGGSGSHPVVWRAVGSSAGYADNFRGAYVDGVSFAPASEVPLAIALDQPDRTFRTGGSTAPWAGSLSAAGEGGHLAFARMLSTDSGPGAWIETDVDGPGLLTFRQWSSRTDLPLVTLDGNAYTLASNAERSITVGAGRHTIRWTVKPNGDGATETVALDAMHWFPGTWALWQSTAFPSSTPATDRDFAADPDGDGLSNGVEAALGTDPSRPDRNVQPIEWDPKTATQSSRFRYRIARRYPGELTIFVDRATALAGPWTQAGNSVSSGSSLWSGTASTSAQDVAFPGYLFISPYVDTLPASRQRFYRLRVVKP